MALITRHVNTAASSGGDGTTNAIVGANRAYNSLSAAEAAEQTDLVSAGNSIEFVCEGSTADTTACTFAGWTTSASNSILIRPASTDINTTGIFDTSKYRLNPSASFANALLANAGYLIAEDLQIYITGLYATGFRVNSTNATAKFRRGIIRGSGANNQSGAHLAATGGLGVVENSFVYGFTGSVAVGIYGNGSSTGDCQIASNTVYGSTKGIQTTSGIGSNSVLYNNLVTDCTTDYDLAAIPQIATNISSDATSPDVALRNKTITYPDAAGFDFKTTDSDVTEAGTDLTSNTFIPLEVDYFGTNRGSNWDIGAYQSTVVASDTTGTISISNDSDTGSASGTVELLPITGTISQTNESDTASIAGDVAALPVTGVIAHSSDSDSATISASLTIDGSITTTSFDDAAVVLAGLSIEGVVSSQCDSDSSAAIGSISDEGAIAFTTESDSTSIVGDVGLKAIIDFTTGADSASVVASMTVSGTVNITSDSDSASLVGTAPGVVDVEGVISFTTEGDQSSISGATSSPDVNGTISFTCSDDSGSLSGDCTVYGVVSGAVTDTASIIVNITQPVWGDVNVDNDSDSADMQGEITQPVFGSVALQNANDACSIVAAISQAVYGAITQVTDDDEAVVISELVYTIVSEPSTISKAESGLVFTVRGSAETPTVVNTSIFNAGAELTVTAVNSIGSGQYEITCTADVDIPKQAGSYVWTIKVGSDEINSSLIPLTVQSGWDRVGLVSPGATEGQMLYGFVNSAATTGDDIEFEITADFSVLPDGTWFFSSRPGSTVVVNRRVVQANGGVGTTAAFTFL